MRTKIHGEMMKTTRTDRSRYINIRQKTLRLNRSTNVQRKKTTTFHTNGKTRVHNLSTKVNANKRKSKT